MRKKTEAKRQAILQIAAEVFRSMGFDNASMAEIAARLGGSKATLYNYFRSKEELFVEVMRGVAQLHQGDVESYLDQPCPAVTREAQARADEMFAQLLEEGDHRQILLHFGQKFIAFASSAEIMTVRRMLFGEAARSDVGRHFYERGPRRGMERIAAYLGKLMAAGQLRQADAALAAAQLRALLEAEWYERFLLGVESAMDAASLKTRAKRAIEAFLVIYGA